MGCNDVDLISVVGENGSDFFLAGRKRAEVLLQLLRPCYLLQGGQSKTQSENSTFSHGISAQQLPEVSLRLQLFLQVRAPNTQIAFCCLRTYLFVN